MLCKSKCAIVVTTTHADTVVVSIENSHRQNYPVERAGRYCDAVNRFPDSELVADHFGFRRELQEKHFVIARNSRCVYAFANRPGGADECVEIDFIVSGQIDAYGSRTCELPRSKELPVYRIRCDTSFQIGQLSSCVQMPLPKLIDKIVRCSWHVRESGGEKRRLPRVPLRTVALEPEQQVGPAVTATGLPTNRPCSNAIDSTRPRCRNLGSKGIRVRIEHRRRRQTPLYRVRGRAVWRNPKLIQLGQKCLSGDY